MRPTAFPKLGDVVAVTFLDHAEKSDTLLEFTAYGRVAILTPEAITIDCWHYAAGAERDGNVERFTIARGVVKAVNVWKANKA